MGVVVFDSDVLIGFLNRDDAHHADAVAIVRRAMAPGARRLLCAINYAEVMVGPLRAGTHELVDHMLVQLGIETVAVDRELGRRAAAVRARTNLKLPDAFALATALQAAQGGETVDLASFDDAVRRADRQLRPSG